MCSSNFDRMMIGPALSTRLPFEDEGATVLGSRLDGAERAALLDRIAADGAAFVGQEAVTLSTTPVFVGGFLEPRPASAARLSGAHAGRLDRHARRLRAHRLLARHHRDRHAARRPGRRRLDRQQQAR